MPPSDPATRLSALNLSARFTFAQLLAALESFIGKPIVVIATADARLGPVTGLWADTESAAYFICRAFDPNYYRVLVLGHEIGHLLCGHTKCGEVHEGIEALLADLIPGRRLITVRARDLSWGPDEIEAESIAQLILLRTTPSEADTDLDLFGG